MVIVIEVVHLRLMELSWNTPGSTSDGTASLLWHSTSVVSQIVHIVLLALLFELSHSQLSIATLCRSRLRNVTSRISLTRAVGHFKVSFAHLFVCIGILPSEYVIVGS